MARDRNCPRFRRVVKLPMASFGSSNTPAILLQALDYVADLHTSEIVTNRSTEGVGASACRAPHSFTLFANKWEVPIWRERGHWTAFHLLVRRSSGFYCGGGGGGGLVLWFAARSAVRSVGRDPAGLSAARYAALSAPPCGFTGSMDTTWYSRAIQHDPYKEYLTHSRFM